MSNWVKIEDAPRVEQENCMLFIPDSAVQEIVIGYWSEGDWMERTADGGGFPIDMPVTHYMPLPDEPEDA